MNFKWYNQNLERYSRSGCSVYTLFNIIQLQWGIKYTNDFIIETLKIAEKDKAFFETWWAYFDIIYNWFSTKIFEYTWLKTKIRVVNINNDDFEDLLEKGYYFWLWLLNAWLWYRKAREDWIIDEKDFIIDKGSTFWHNHTYWKLGNKYAIFDSLWSVWAKPIYMDLKTLRELVNKWIYYANARTIVLEDQRLDNRLRFFKTWWVVKDITKENKVNQKAIERALKLRVFHK